MQIEFVAPSEIYKIPRQSARERVESIGYTLPQPTGLTKTQTGGVATIIPGHPFPRKGFVYVGITQPNNKAKRLILNSFMPFFAIKKGPKEFLNSYFLNLNRLIDSVYRDCDQLPYLHYEYYSEFGKSLWDFVYLFLRRLGVENEIAFNAGLNFTTTIEYDDAYRTPLVDIMNESLKQNFLQNPRKEILRLVKIFESRVIHWEKDNENTMGERMIRMAKIFSLLLYVPFIKRAFKFAIENINYDYFKLDEWDEYWMLNRSGYNCLGLTFEQRKPIMIQKMVEFAQQMNPDKEVRVEVNEEGETFVKTYPKNF